MQRLNGKRIALLIETGFDSKEFICLKSAMEQAGAEVETISPAAEAKSFGNDGWGEPVKLDKSVEVAKPKDYDGLMIPGGLIHADKLRSSDQAIEFVKHFLEEGSPIAAFGHGVQVLIGTGEVSGLYLTAPASVKKDLQYVGAHFVDEPIVMDHGLVTGSNIEHLSDFCEKVVMEFASELHPSHVRLPRTLQSQVLH